MNMMRVDKALLYHVSLFNLLAGINVMFGFHVSVYQKDSLLLFLDYLIAFVSKRQNVA